MFTLPISHGVKLRLKLLVTYSVILQLPAVYFGMWEPSMKNLNNIIVMHSMYCYDIIRHIPKHNAIVFACLTPFRILCVTTSRVSPKGYEEV
jgi:hypothetical protein